MPANISLAHFYRRRARRASFSIATRRTWPPRSRKPPTAAGRLLERTHILRRSAKPELVGIFVGSLRRAFELDAFEKVLVGVGVSPAALPVRIVDLDELGHFAKVDFTQVPSFVSR